MTDSLVNTCKLEPEVTPWQFLKLWAFVKIFDMVGSLAYFEKKKVCLKLMINSPFHSFSLPFFLPSFSSCVRSPCLNYLVSTEKGFNKQMFSSLRIRIRNTDLFIYYILLAHTIIVKFPFSPRPDKHGRVFLVNLKKWVFHCTVVYNGRVNFHKVPEKHGHV